MLAIHQEPLIGDRQFWVTRPYPRSSLVMAKALFVTAFILVPKLIADAAILAFSGFSPLSNLGQLLWKQVALASARITRAALAATTELSQFILVAIGSGGVAAMFSEPLSGYPSMRDGIGRSRVVAVASGLILLVQYTRRRNRLSQTLAVATAISSVVLFLYLPGETTFRLACATSGRTHDGLAIRVASDVMQPPTFTYSNARQIAAPIPVTVDGIPRSARAIFEMLESEIVLPSGERWKTVTRGTQSDRPTQF
jgi:hypothetical protein